MTSYRTLPYGYAAIGLPILWLSLFRNYSRRCQCILVSSSHFSLWCRLSHLRLRLLVYLPTWSPQRWRSWQVPTSEGRASECRPRKVSPRRSTIVGIVHGVHRRHTEDARVCYRSSTLVHSLRNPEQASDKVHEETGTGDGQPSEILPKLTYASIVCGRTTMTNRKRIQTAQYCTPWPAEPRRWWQR